MNHKARAEQMARATIASTGGLRAEQEGLPALLEPAQKPKNELNGTLCQSILRKRTPKPCTAAGKGAPCVCNPFSGRRAFFCRDGQGGVPFKYLRHRVLGHSLGRGKAQPFL